MGIETLDSVLLGCYPYWYCGLSKGGPEGLHDLSVHLACALYEVRREFKETSVDMGGQMEFADCEEEFLEGIDVEVRVCLDASEKVDAVLASDIVHEHEFFQPIAVVGHGPRYAVVHVLVPNESVLEMLLVFVE